MGKWHLLLGRTTLASGSPIALSERLCTTAMRMARRVLPWRSFENRIRAKPCWVKSTVCGNTWEPDSPQAWRPANNCFVLVVLASHSTDPGMSFGVG